MAKDFWGHTERRINSMRFFFIHLVLGFALLVNGGCAQFEFDVTQAGSNEPVHVATTDDAHLNNDPLRYRFRADDGRLVMWIENPTNDPIELIGRKSSVTDPDGVDHPLHGKSIGPMTSIKEILPPLESEGQQAAPNSLTPLNPYDEPGFIAVPGIGQSDSIGSDPGEGLYDWQWDGESEIRLHLFFVQSGRQFEQRFTIHRVKK
jgi:hypothetical protein